MAMTAWSANVSISAISRSENGRTSQRAVVIAPIGTPSRSNGVARTVRWPTICCNRRLVWKLRLDGDCEIVDVDGLAIEDGTAGDRGAADRADVSSVPRRRSIRVDRVDGREMEHAVLDPGC